jgi:hypothetical protein
MAKGKEVADAFFERKMTGDVVMDAVIARVPKLEIMDVEFMSDFRTSSREIIPLWIQPDSYRKDLTEYLEYKTSQRPWTQKQADEHGQITFYDVGIFCLKNFIPRHKLIDIRTAKENPDDPNSRIVATGEFKEIETKRSILDIIKMIHRIDKAVKEISEEYQKFLF